MKYNIKELAHKGAIVENHGTVFKVGKDFVVVYDTYHFIEWFTFDPIQGKWALDDFNGKEIITIKDSEKDFTIFKQV